MAACSCFFGVFLGSWAVCARLVGCVSLGLLPCQAQLIGPGFAVWVISGLTIIGGLSGIMMDHVLCFFPRLLCRNSKWMVSGLSGTAS